MTGFEIAVVGMAGRFPGAVDIESFWGNLMAGTESITFFSQEELLDTGYVPARGVIPGRELFDHEYFDINPLEAELLDPQVRHFLQCCVHALEDAGVVAAETSGPIGLYAGAGNALLWDAAQLFSPRAQTIGPFAASLLRKDYLCSKTSYMLGLNGPAVSVQTACSTSLVAIHLACQGLIGGECDLALAGGVTICHEGPVGYLYQDGMIGSPDGHCRPFDRQAAGTVPGEGVGVVALKRLSDALAERHHIYALVKGSAINNDGCRKVGFTAPSVAGQAEVIQNALAMAAVPEDSIGYIEAHGTGTPLGDPIELSALRKVFPSRDGIACPIGSVKSNTGHLDAAAGVAGFIKTALCLYHRQIPPSLHFDTPNPALNIKNSRFFVNTEPRRWDHGQNPRRAGVSSFGIGGTNAHIILEEFIPSNDPPASSSLSFHVLPLSAKTESVLTAATRQFAEYLSKHPDTNLEDAAYTLQTGRRHFQYRAGIVASSSTEAVELLSDAPQSQTAASAPSIIFMFPGQGAQHTAMGRRLYHSEPIFHDALDHCFHILESQSSLRLQDYLQSDQDQLGEAIPDTAVAQPLLVSFQYAMAVLLRHWGVTPAAMIGHSVGQFTAACLAGVLSLEDCLSLTAQRGRLLKSLPGGAMLAVPLPEHELLPLLGQSLSLAAVNGPNRCVASGSGDAIERLRVTLENQGVDSTPLHTSHAFHSHMMDPIIDDFANLAGSVALNPPAVPIVSNLTGSWLTEAEAQDPRYWADHLRRAVRFSEGMSTLATLNRPIFIDIGPGNPLATFARQHPATGPAPFVVQCAPHPKDNTPDDKCALQCAGRLWQWGAAIDWEAFNHGRAPQRIPLPGYPFAHHTFPAQLDLSNVQLPETASSAAQTTSAPQPATAHAPTVKPSPSNVERVVISTFESFFAVSPITASHDFYDLGGDSLSAVQLANLLRQQGLDVNFRQLLMNPMIADFCRGLQPPAPETPTTSYTISPVQRFALDSQDPGLEADFILFHLDLPQSQTIQNARHTLELMMERNPLMRSQIVQDNDGFHIQESPIPYEVELPVVDLSHLTPPRRDEQLLDHIRQLRRPIDMSQSPLFRPLLVRLSPDSLRMVIAFHHLIFDGASVTVLREQRQTPTRSYRDYVEFLEKQDYSDVQLDAHIDLCQYAAAIQAAGENFETAAPAVDQLEIHLDLIPEPFRHAYEDILLLAFGELIRRACGCDAAPIAQVSNGRVYGDARFTDVVGDFHDVIPLLLDPRSVTDPGPELQRLRDFRGFVKTHNLNFLNYLQQQSRQIPPLQDLVSPFGFNAVPASIESFHHSRSFQPDLQIPSSQTKGPAISLQLFEDLSNQRLCSVFIHNSRFPVKEEFPGFISAIARQLD